MGKEFTSVTGEIENKERSSVGQKIEGWVFDLQRFSLHDGPGIRTVVFLKGCPLRCLWCDNPESHSLFAEIAEFPEKCIGCKSCLKVCPEGAITKNNWRINRVLCTTCAKCVEACPSGARKIFGVKISAENVVEEIGKDRLFYDNSGGGVTLSGGEPLMQPTFSREILTLCKKRGIHTAMETCGYAPWAELENILPFLDLILYDIKHTDPVKHMEFTGVSNQLILENFASLARLEFPVIIRVPLIPGYTDTKDNIESVIKLLKPYGHLQQIDLLPYHKLGMGKYERLGKKYKLIGVNPPNEDNIQKIKQMLKSLGFEVRVGG